ncbi:SCO4225 family membrane protein [Modestobacter sp. SYSU DS0290]
MDGRRNWPVWVAGAYAVAVLATTVWVQVAAAGAEDASFAGIWLLALTLPGSLLALLLVPGELGSLLIFTVVGLLQAAGTWWLLTRLRIRRADRPVRG